MPGRAVPAIHTSRQASKQATCQSCSCRPSFSTLPPPPRSGPDRPTILAHLSIPSDSLVHPSHHFYASNPVWPLITRHRPHKAVAEAAHAHAHACLLAPSPWPCAPGPAPALHPACHCPPPSCPEPPDCELPSLGLQLHWHASANGTPTLFGPGAPVHCYRSAPSQRVQTAKLPHTIPRDVIPPPSPPCRPVVRRGPLPPLHPRLLQSLNTSNSDTSLGATPTRPLNIPLHKLRHPAPGGPHAVTSPHNRPSPAKTRVPASRPTSATSRR